VFFARPLCGGEAIAMKVTTQTNTQLTQMLRDRGVEQGDLSKAADEVRRLNPGKIGDDLSVTAGQTLQFPDQLQLGDRSVQLRQVTGDDSVSNIPVTARQGGTGSAMGALGRFAFQAPEANQGTVVLDALRDAADPGHLSNAIADAEAFLDQNMDQLSGVEKMKFLEAIDGARAELNAGIDLDAGPTTGTEVLQAFSDAADPGHLSNAIADAEAFLDQNMDNLSGVEKMKILEAIDGAREALDDSIE
jgi:hypothetical protein